MNYITYQIIILLDDALESGIKGNIVKEIKSSIEKFTKRITIKYEGRRNLAYPIGEHEKAWLAAIQINLREVGSNKRIREIKEKLNTYEEIISFKIVEKTKKNDNNNNDDEIYIVYEFDYGDISQGTEPNVTIFDGYDTREGAEEKANELLQEGLENYFIESYLSDIDNPFKNNNEVHLYETELENEQENSVYYIKIEKINLNRKIGRRNI